MSAAEGAAAVVAEGAAEVVESAGKTFAFFAVLAASAFGMSMVIRYLCDRLPAVELGGWGDDAPPADHDDEPAYELPDDDDQGDGGNGAIGY